MTFNTHRIAKGIWFTGVYFFALVGFVMVAGYLAVSTGLSNVKGTTDTQASRYNDLNNDLALGGAVKGASTEVQPVAQTPVVDTEKGTALCQLNVLAQIAPRDAYEIWAEFQSSHSVALLRRMNLALTLQAERDVSYQNAIQQCAHGEQKTEEQVATHFVDGLPTTPHVYTWMTGEQWRVISAALEKDAPTLNRAAEAAGIPPRMIASTLIVEQLRLYYTQRELFEKVFKPLTILSSANKMAWGVMAIKEKTAIQIEQQLHDTGSPYYLGADKEGLLAFTGNPSGERYTRLTNDSDHYYSYLYGGLMLKQYVAQWQSAGVDISARPEILATLFNIGFKNSHPKENPEVGGSTINVAGRDYTFGSLAYEFYYSGELSELFPYPKN